MKKFVFAMVMVLAIAFVSCNSTPTDGSATSTDSTVVQVDSLQVDSTAVDTTKAVK